MSTGGYDSVGFAVLSNGKIVMRKNKGEILGIEKKLEFNEIENRVAISDEAIHHVIGNLPFHHLHIITLFG